MQSRIIFWADDYDFPNFVNILRAENRFRSVQVSVLLIYIYAPVVCSWYGVGTDGPYVSNISTQSVRSHGSDVINYWIGFSLFDITRKPEWNSLSVPLHFTVAEPSTVCMDFTSLSKTINALCNKSFWRLYSLSEFDEVHDIAMDLNQLYDN